MCPKLVVAISVSLAAQPMCPKVGYVDEVRGIRYVDGVRGIRYVDGAVPRKNFTGIRYVDGVCGIRYSCLGLAWLGLACLVLSCLILSSLVCLQRNTGVPAGRQE